MSSCCPRSPCGFRVLKCWWCFIFMHLHLSCCILKPLSAVHTNNHMCNKTITRELHFFLIACTEYDITNVFVWSTPSSSPTHFTNSTWAFWCYSNMKMQSSISSTRCNYVTPVHLILSSQQGENCSICYLKGKDCCWHLNKQVGNRRTAAGPHLMYILKLAVSLCKLTIVLLWRGCYWPAVNRLSDKRHVRIFPPSFSLVNHHHVTQVSSLVIHVT